MGADSVEKEFKCRAIVNRASSHDSPDAFAPGTATFAAGALCDQTVYNYEADGAFGDVVCGADAVSGDELEVGFAVVAKAVGHVLSGPGGWYALGSDSDNPAALFAHCSVERGFGHGFAPMDDAEHVANLGEQEFAVGGGGFVRQCGEKFHVADQVCDAELNNYAEVLHVFAVCPEVIAPQHAVEFLAEYADEDFRSARFVDAEQHVEIGAETPCPEPVTVVLVSGFIDVDKRFGGEPLKQFLIRSFEGGGGFADEFRKVAA